jgi:histone-lysine N-methyltransferase SETD1
VIDAVAKGSAKKPKVRVVVETSADNEYSRPENKKKPGKKDQPVVRPIASEWRKAKDKKLKHDSFTDLSPVRPVTPQPQYRKRTVMEEMDILYEFLRIGIDEEDVQFLRKSYETMLQEENHYWLNDTHWVDHPATLIPSPKKRKKTDDVRVHVTGCARSEGYYKMDDNEKRQHSHVANVKPDDVDPKQQLRARAAIAATSTREARSYQRRLLATADAAGWSDLLKFNQLQVNPQ